MTDDEKIELLANAIRTLVHLDYQNGSPMEWPHGWRQSLAGTAGLTLADIDRRHWDAALAKVAGERPVVTRTRATCIVALVIQPNGLVTYYNHTTGDLHYNLDPRSGQEAWEGLCDLVSQKLGADVAARLAAAACVELPRPRSGEIRRIGPSPSPQGGASAQG